jgi:hypothetical protein
MNRSVTGSEEWGAHSDFPKGMIYRTGKTITCLELEVPAYVVFNNNDD